jgi:predicted nucleic acid-binding protein
LTPIVLDASAGVEIALQTTTGRALQERLPPNADPWVPDHYFAEVAAVLRRRALLQPDDEARVGLALTRVLDAPMRRVSVKPLLYEAWPLRHNMTIADALYVVVALHLDAPLVTTDLRLARAPGLAVATITPE